jgi:uncharacterized DUF497 family protein
MQTPGQLVPVVSFWRAIRVGRSEGRSKLQEAPRLFDEAATVFRDSLASIFEDPDHSVGERREILIGHSLPGRLLLVSFMDRGEVIRLISARETDARERRKYEETS